jgi:RNA polymerase sigma factor (sigma-70 family)
MAHLSEIFGNCKNGDPKAQRMLYDLYKSRLMGLCRRYTRDPSEAQDVLQESFIKIFNKIDHVSEASKLEGWMRSVTIRTAIDQYHKTRSHDSVFQDNEITIHERELETISLADASDEYLVRLINQLPDGCRVIFNLFIVEGYNHTEIAGMLKVTEGTSRSQLHRAKQLLREKLKSHNLADYYEKLG